MSFQADQISHLYEFESNFLNRNGLRLHYLDEGRGEPVVALHGNPSWSFMYRDLIRSLRQRYRVIVPDHMGCGLSDKPPDSLYCYRLEQRVADLDALLRHLRLRQSLTLIMHDWGGPIGMTWATRHPNRIRRLVVLNTAAFPVPPGQTLHWTLRWCRSLRPAGWLIRRFNAFARVASRVGCRRRPMSRQVRRAYLGPYDSWDHRIATLRFVEDIPLIPADPSFALLEQTGKSLHRLADHPLLICWGEKDFVFTGAFLQEWLKRFPRAEVHRFAEAGHCVLEDEGDKIVPLIGEFLGRVQGRQGA